VSDFLRAIGHLTFNHSFYVVSVIDTSFCVCMLLNLLNKCACIINLIEISIFFFNIDLFKDRVLFVRVFKSTGYYLSTCANRRGTICPHVQKRRGTICPGYSFWSDLEIDF